jgi:hypothetical protein
MILIAYDGSSSSPASHGTSVAEAILDVAENATGVANKSTRTDAATLRAHTGSGRPTALCAGPGGHVA